MAQPDTIKNAKASLLRIQNFDANSIARVEDLGKGMNFSSCISTAQKTVNFFKLIPEALIDDLSEAQSNALRSGSDSAFQVLDRAVRFKGGEGEHVHNEIKRNINESYDRALDQLVQLVAFSVTKNTDTNHLQSNAQEIIQKIKEESTAATDHLKNLKGEADRTLQTIRATAAEQGVTQQAKHFADSVTDHSKAAHRWLIATILVSSLLAGLAVGSLFLHKWAFIKPTDAFETVQLITGKAIVFATVTYILVLCAKNYLSHRHNAVVNRHRQNALLTYRSLTDAAGTKATGDIVLAHAASCIFSPQETGYTKPGVESSGPRGVLELLTKATGDKSSS